MLPRDSHADQDIYRGASSPTYTQPRNPISRGKQRSNDNEQNKSEELIPLQPLGASKVAVAPQLLPGQRASTMKFSHSLQFNSVPDWADKYVAYSNLKKAIYMLEKDQTLDASLEQPYTDRPHDVEAESASLLHAPEQSDTNRTFIPLLDKELAKIVDFYSIKEREQFTYLQDLKQDLERTENEDLADSSGGAGFSDEDEDDDEDGDGAENESAYTGFNASRHGTKRNAPRRRLSIDAIFTDPQRYNEASRHAQQYRNQPKSPVEGSSRMGRRNRQQSIDGVDCDGVQAEPTAAETAVPDVMGIAASRGKLHRTTSGLSQTAGPTKRWTLFGKRTSRHRSRSLGLSIPPDGYPASAGGQLSASAGADSDAGGSSWGEGKSMSIWTAQNDYAIDMRITFKKRVTDLFVSFSELKQYVQLNETGIRKILKKYDKITKNDLKDPYMRNVVQKAYPFQDERRRRLDESITTLTQLYAKVVTGGDLELALSQLKTHLREQVVWQRNTVWREMISIERRAQGAGLSQTVMGSGANKDGEPVKQKAFRTPCGNLRLPAWLGMSTVQLVVAFVVFVAFLRAPGLRIFSRVEEQNCLAMLLFCTILWATEVIPLFVTSLLVPLLVVTLRVGRTDDIEDRRMTASESTKWIFSTMFAPNMCLLLGGFTLAAALSKYGIDKILATKVLRLAGTRPSLVLLAHMCVACFASMWISNVAAPVLMYSLIQPILRTLPPKSTFAQSLIMGIALASNIGGQTSPIASPQNLIALQYMSEPVGWLQWFAITIPVSGLSLFVIWLLLLWSYGSGKGTVIKAMSQNKDSFTPIQYFISAVSLGTIVLWCIERNIEWVVGDMGVLAIIPIILFFGTGILTKEDFNNFLWTIVFLAMGGIALGKAVTSSGLLESMDSIIQEVVKGMPIWKVLVSLLCIGLAVATFISHTIAAVLLVPIAAQVGDSLAEPHPRLLIMATVLTASAAMGLPVSGFPNMTAVSMEDELGQRYVTVKDFLRVGVLASVLATVIVGTIGFAAMLWLQIG